MCSRECKSNKSRDQGAKVLGENSSDLTFNSQILVDRENIPFSARIELDLMTQSNKVYTTRDRFSSDDVRARGIHVQVDKGFPSTCKIEGRHTGRLSASSYIEQHQIDRCWITANARNSRFLDAMPSVCHSRERVGRMRCYRDIGESKKKKFEIYSNSTAH